ncbi:MAG TPA: hypothetical protein VK738_20750 [Terriglobales bacterium]|jgi:hypothetical protein|nr:hypothetical protein [Terriglobales bacterium]
MNHLSEQQIILHYFGDAESEEEIRSHLAQCHACRTEFEGVQSLLGKIEPTEVPEPPSFFEEKMWLNLRDRLPAKRSGFRQWLRAPKKWALAPIAVLLLAAAFMAGRFWPRPPIVALKPNPQLVVLVAVGDHLERSQMLLVEIMNADTNAGHALDVSDEQQQARDLLDANHLYRLSAQHVGDPQVAGVLDDLGRVLAEIANGPSELSPDELKEIRTRIQSQELLFKIKVIDSQVDSKVRRQEQAPAGDNKI